MLMKNFTLSCLCAVAAMLSMAQTASAITITEVFGKYEFQADVEFTAEGQKYKDVLTTGTEVIISKDKTYMCQISPVAGGEETHYVNKLEGDVLRVYNPNGSSYYYWTSQSLAMCDLDGTYPHGGAFEMTYTYDEATGDLLMKDFAAADCYMPEDPVVIMAKFTNCRLKLIEKEQVEIVDLSGEYSCVAQYYDTESTFSNTFDFTLTAANGDFTAYKAEISIDGLQPVVIENATFDGVTLSIPLDNTCLDEQVPYYLMSMASPRSLTQPVTFNLIEYGKLSIYSGMAIATPYEEEVEQEDGTTKTVTKYKFVQYYSYGVAKMKGLVEETFEGTYHVTSDYVFDFKPEENWPREFDMVIEDGQDGYYYITEFMGYDTFSYNYGGIPGEVVDGKLVFEVGPGYSTLNRRDMADDYSWILYDVMYDGVGGTSEPVTLTRNDDGTCTLSDFFVKRVVLYGETEKYPAEANVMYYSNMSAVTGIKGVTVADEDGPTKVYNINGVCLGSSLDNLPKGVYVVKSGSKSMKIAK